MQPSIEYGIIAGNFIMENDVTSMSLKEAQEKSIERAHGARATGTGSLFDENDDE